MHAAADINIINKSTTELFPEKVDYSLPDNLNECNGMCEEVESHEAQLNDTERLNFSKSEDLHMSESLESKYIDEQIGGTQDDEDLSSFNYNDSCHNYHVDHLTSSDNYSDESDTTGIEDENMFTLFDKIMFPPAELTIRSIILICTAFALRNHISSEALLELVNILKLCAGPAFANLNLSKYIMSQCFSARNENITYNYYCIHCKNNIIYPVNATARLKKYTVIYEKCKNHNCITSATFFNNILQNLQSENYLNKGSIYQNIKSSRKSDEEILLTLNCNTDGAPLTKSGKTSFWPFQVALNELSDELKSRFILLTALLMVQAEPNSNLMNLYLSKFVEQIKLLYYKGITVTHNNRTYLVRLCTLSFSVDSVCRPIMQNRIQFNGYYGCSWCYQIGQYIKTVTEIRYVLNQTSELRNHESHVQDVKQVQESGCNTRGVKGYSALLELPHIDIVWSMSYEYMHGMILGVVLQLINLWKKKECKFQINNKNSKIMDNQYVKITPPREIHRLPRSEVINGTTKPKASELKSWLLYFSLPLLKNVLHPDALRHFTLLVKNAYTLLSTDISEYILDECERDLITFVCQFEDLYGCEVMTFNVHTLMHCVQSVRKIGPLHQNSAFPFECSMYTLKQYINGPTGMDRQIARKHLQKLLFQCNAKEFIGEVVSEKILNYCSNMFVPRRLTTYYKQMENTIFCGKALFKNDDQMGTCITYQKCIYKGTVYHTKSYVKEKKNDDSFIQLDSGNFYRIIEIMHCDDNCMLRLQSITLFNDVISSIRHIKQILKEEPMYSIVNINAVNCKAIFVKVDNISYLCSMPNTFDVQ